MLVLVPRLVHVEVEVVVEGVVAVDGIRKRCCMLTLTGKNFMSN